MKFLNEFPSGARVFKADAICFDFAFNRIGTVYRENVDGRECIGVLWDGGNSIVEYPEGWPGFESAIEAEHIRMEV